MASLSDNRVLTISGDGQTTDALSPGPFKFGKVYFPSGLNSSYVTIKSKAKEADSFQTESWEDLSQARTDPPTLTTVKITIPSGGGAVRLADDVFPCFQLELYFDQSETAGIEIPVYLHE